MKPANLSTDLHRLDREISSVLRPTHSFLAPINRQIPWDGGKKLRGRLILIIGRLFGAHPRDLAGTAAAVEVVHLATLIHDDVIDSALQRRSRPALQRVYGVAPALLYGDLLFSRAISRVNRIGNQILTDLLLETVGSLCAGEILENQLSRKFPWTEKDYLKVARLKTASLFEYGCRAPGILAGLPTRRLTILTRFGRNLGLSYQAFDDCLDFSLPGKKAGKDVLADLKNGVPNLPLVLAGRDTAIRDELKIKLLTSLTAEESSRLARLIREGGFVQAARARAREYLEGALWDGKVIGRWGDPCFAKLLESFLTAFARLLDGPGEC